MRDSGADHRDSLAVATLLMGVACAFLLAPGEQMFGLRALLIVLTAAAVIDIRTLRIPNEVSVAAFVSAVVEWAAAGTHAMPIIAAGATAAMMLVAFVLGGAGGGDVKVLPSLVLAATATFSGPAVTMLAASVLLLTVFLIALAFHVLSGAGRNGASALAPSMLLAGALPLTVGPHLPAILGG